MELIRLTTERKKKDENFKGFDAEHPDVGCEHIGDIFSAGCLHDYNEADEINDFIRRIKTKVETL